MMGMIRRGGDTQNGIHQPAGIKNNTRVAVGMVWRGGDTQNSTLKSAGIKNNTRGTLSVTCVGGGCSQIILRVLKIIPVLWWNDSVVGGKQHKTLKY